MKQHYGFYALLCGADDCGVIPKPKILTQISLHGLVRPVHQLKGGKPSRLTYRRSLPAPGPGIHILTCGVIPVVCVRLCRSGPTQWPRLFQIAKPAPAHLLGEGPTSQRQENSTHTQQVWGLGGHETKKLKPNNLCTQSEIQKNEVSKKRDWESGRLCTYIQRKDKGERRSTPPYLPSTT